MTELLEKTVATVRSLPRDTQDAIARMVLAYVGDASLFELTPEEDADLDRSDGEVARGEFATENEVKAIWAKYGP